MFVKFNLYKTRAVDVSDKPLSPFNTDIEVYQTWQARTVASMDTDSNGELRVLQGFSTRGAPDGGVSFSDGETRRLGKPIIAFEVDEEKLEQGETLRIRIDMYWWESDPGIFTRSDSAKVRAAFTSDALKTFYNALHKTTEGNEKARRQFKDWIDNNHERVIREFVNLASSTSVPAITLGEEAVDVVKNIWDIAKQSDDEYIGRSVFFLEIEQVESGGYQWMISNGSSDGDPDYIAPNNERTIEEVELVNASGDIQLLSTYDCRVKD